MIGTGLELPGYDPDYVRVIPDAEHLECFAVECEKRATIVAVTPFGKGAFCQSHGEEVLVCVPGEPHPGRGLLGDQTKHWLAEAFLKQAINGPPS